MRGDAEVTDFSYGQSGPGYQYPYSAAYWGAAGSINGLSASVMQDYQKCDIGLTVMYGDSGFGTSVDEIAELVSRASPACQSAYAAYFCGAICHAFGPGVFDYYTNAPASEKQNLKDFYHYDSAGAKVMIYSNAEMVLSCTSIPSFTFHTSDQCTGYSSAASGNIPSVLNSICGATTIASSQAPSSYQIKVLILTSASPSAVGGLIENSVHQLYTANSWSDVTVKVDVVDNKNGTVSATVTLTGKRYIARGFGYLLSGQFSSSLDLGYFLTTYGYPSTLLSYSGPTDISASTTTTGLSTTPNDGNGGESVVISFATLVTALIAAISY
jgi:hypothetical protein